MDPTPLPCHALPAFFASPLLQQRRGPSLRSPESLLDNPVRQLSLLLQLRNQITPDTVHLTSVLRPEYESQRKRRAKSEASETHLENREVKVSEDDLLLWSLLQKRGKSARRDALGRESATHGVSDGALERQANLRTPDPAFFVSDGIAGRP